MRASGRRPEGNRECQARLSVFERFRLEVRTSVMAGARPSKPSNMSDLHDCQRRTRKHCTVNMGVVSKVYVNASWTRWFVFCAVHESTVQFSATTRKGKSPAHAQFGCRNRSSPTLFSHTIYRRSVVKKEKLSSHQHLFFNPHPRQHVDALAQSIPSIMLFAKTILASLALAGSVLGMPIYREIHPR